MVMKNPLRDPVWQFISVLVAVALAALAYFGRPSKKLRVDVLSNGPIVSVDTNVVKEIQILYRGKPVHTLSLILLKFENTGTEPIRESDYSEPIRASLSPSAEVGDVVVQETRPTGIGLSP